MLCEDVFSLAKNLQQDTYSTGTMSDWLSGLPKNFSSNFLR